LTTVQGKTLAHVFVFALPDSLIIDTVADQAEVILKHLDHYLVSEQVELADRSREWAEQFLAGAQAARVLEIATGSPPPGERLAHRAEKIAGHTVWLRRADLVSTEGFLIAGANDDLPSVQAELLSRGASACDQSAFQAARIEWGFPLFGVDLSEKNLPQEVARDAQAISFVKGCYLGQETVARIDALGHVNKTLCGVRFSGSDIPAPGATLTVAGQMAGEVTSAAFSPALQAPLALAYVRRGSSAPGTTLESAAGPAEVVALPVR
jgi:folate-binding protein YgfZ